MKKNLLLALAGVISLTSLTSCGGDPTTTPIGGSSNSGTSSQGSTSSVAPSTPLPPDEESYGDGTVNVRMWGAADDFGYFRKAVTAYNTTAATEKKIKLTVVGIGEGDAGGKLGEDATTAPDIFHIPGNDIPSLVSKGMIGLIDGTIPSTVSIAEGSLATGRVDDKLYALPYTINTFFLYYNKTVITQVQSFESILGDQVKNGAVRLGMDAGNGFYIQSVLRSYGLNLYGDGGTDNNTTDIVSTDQRVLDATKLLWDMHHQSDVYNKTYNSFIDSMTTGKLATAVDGTWNYQAYADKLGAEDFGMAVLPNLPNGNEWGSPIDNKFIAMNSTLSGAKKTAVQDFLYYLVSDDGQNLRYTERKTLPTATTLLDSEEFKATFLGSECLSDYYNRVDANYKNPTASKFNANFWGNAEAFAAALIAIETWDETAAKAAIDSFGKALIA